MSRQKSPSKKSALSGSSFMRFLAETFCAKRQGHDPKGGPSRQGARPRIAGAPRVALWFRRKRLDLIQYLSPCPK